MLLTSLILERTALLEALTQALHTATAGQGRVALISGEAGLGKTTVVEQLARLEAARLRFLWGACDALFTPRPLGPLYDVAEQTGGPLLEALRTPDAPRQALFSACLTELQRQPGAVIFEDVHWADEATLDLLKFLSRRIQRTPTLLILTYRDDELDAHHPLRQVLGELPRAVADRLPLAPLTAEGVLTLARAAGRPERASALFASTRGNPFFVTEALASDEGLVPPTVRDAVLARAARLSAPARAVLELASLAPGALETSLLEDVLHPTPEAVDECVERGMLRAEGGALAFRHELARLAVAGTLPPARSRDLHAALAAALMPRAEPAQLPRLVHHAAQAELVSTVLEYAPLAARQAAAVSAHREAAAHYQTALRYASALPPEQQAGLLEALAYEHYLTSQIEAAVEARSAALEIWTQLERPDKQGHNLRWLSRLHWFLGQRAEAERFAAQALRRLEPLPPSAELAMAYSNRAQLHMLANQVEEALRAGQQAIDLAEALDDTEVLCHALNNVGTAAIINNYDPIGRAALERSLGLALAHELQEHAARAYTNLGSEAVSHRVYADAMQRLNDGIAYCVERDLDAWNLYMRAWRARAYLEQGAWTEAAGDALAVLDHPQATAVARIPALAVLGLVRARRGDPGADPLLEEAHRLATGSGELQRIVPVTAARAEAAWLRGELAARTEELGATLALALNHGTAWQRGELATWLRRAGALAEPPTDLLEPHARELAGDWTSAAAAWARLGCPYERALALMQGDTAAQLAALEILEGLSARPAAERVRHQLAERSPRAVARDRFGGLTEREREVAALIAQGKSNREIAHSLVVGTRTAETYISRILNKLNFSSRVQIATWALEKGLAPPAPDP